VNHDSYANDFVDAKLSPGEVVVDKDTMNDSGKYGKEARDLKKHLAEKNKK